ncbi:ribonuclease H-like domain-containing protein [Tanacetum coccineum]
MMTFTYARSTQETKLLGILYNRLNSVSIIVSSASRIVSTGRRIIIVSTGSVKKACVETVIRKNSTGKMARESKDIPHPTFTAMEDPIMQEEGKRACTTNWRNFCPPASKTAELAASRNQDRRGNPNRYLVIALIMRNKPDIDEIDIDDLYNNQGGYVGDCPESIESSFKGQEGIWTSKKNDLFLLTSQRLSATTVIEKGILLENEDLEGALVAQDGLGGYDFEVEPVNYALMAISSSSSSSSSDSEIQQWFKKHDYAGRKKCVVNTGKGKLDTDLKKSRWVWRPKGNYLDHVSKDSGSFMLKKRQSRDLVKIIAVVDCGCSRHMDGNIAYMSTMKTLQWCFVAFGSLCASQKRRLNYGCDNGTEFKNHAMNELCAKKGIKREFSVARTPQQNGVAERKNKTLIEAARTMLADSLLPIPFWERQLICTQDSYIAGSSRKDKGPTQEYILLPLQPYRTRIPVKDVVQIAQEKTSENASSDKDVRDSKDVVDKEEQHQMQDNEKDLSNTPNVSAASTSTGANADESSFVYLGGKIPIDASTLPNADLPIDPNMPDLEDASDTLPNDGIFNGAYDDDEDVGAVADFNNMDNTIAFKQEGRFKRLLQRNKPCNARGIAPIQVTAGLDTCGFAFWKEGNWHKVGFKKQKINDKDVPAIGEKVAEVKEEEPVKRTGKRKKQKARKGISVDKNAQGDSETDKEESVEAMNPTPLATKSNIVVNWKIFQQGQRSIYQIMRANGANTVYMSFGAMIKDFTREDLIELYRTMFDPPLNEDAIWSLPLQQKMSLSRGLELRSDEEEEYEVQVRPETQTYQTRDDKKFKNHAMNELCAKKGIKREFSVARTPQQNGVAERENMTLIEAARTMLADLLLPIPFWAERQLNNCLAMY